MKRQTVTSIRLACLAINVACLFYSNEGEVGFVLPSMPTKLDSQYTKQSLQFETTLHFELSANPSDYFNWNKQMILEG